MARPDVAMMTSPLPHHTSHLEYNPNGFEEESSFTISNNRVPIKSLEHNAESEYRDPFEINIGLQKQKKQAH